MFRGGVEPVKEQGADRPAADQNGPPSDLPSGEVHGQAAEPTLTCVVTPIGTRGAAARPIVPSPDGTYPPAIEYLPRLSCGS